MAETRVWYHGRIFTGRRIVERLIADGDRIVAAGPGGPGGPDVPTAADRVDLGGRLVVPAFLDAHLHLTESALRSAGVDLRGTRSFAEIGERVRRHAHGPDRAAIWGGGWDQDRLVEGRYPTRLDLDRWSPDRPLLLTRNCEHVAALNSAGLAAIGLTRSAPEIPGGVIERETDGAPNGIVRERALALLRKFPFPRLDERPELGEQFLARCATLGLAGIAGLRASIEEVAWLQARRSTPGGAGVPRYRAYGSASEPGDIERWAAVRGSRGAPVDGIKLFADGSFGARSAWLEHPYSDAPHESGGPVHAIEGLAESIRTADTLGLRVAIHALGDRGIRSAVEALERVGPSHRPRIEHAGLLPDTLIRRLSAIDADVVVQPGFRTSDTWLGGRLGPARVRDVYPFASLRRRGIRMAASSDAPVESLDPLEGIRSAVAADGVGEPIGALEALELYTRGAAEVLGFSDLGHLEIGASASLVALDLTDPAALGGLPRPAARSVWLEGRPVPATTP